MRARIPELLKRTSLIVAATLMLVAYPATARADTTTGGDSASTSAPTTSTTGPQSPTGADAKTYTYNSATGLWENDYYTWNPATSQTTPKTAQNYSYNPATGHWDTNSYKYDSGSGTYIPNTPSLSPAPSNTSDSTDPTASANTNTPDSSNGDNQTFNNFYNASVSNKTMSQAITGDAGVFGNTTGGNATSGNATAISNTINLLQSSASFATSGAVTTFTANITTDISGDLLLDPVLILSLQPAASSNGSDLPNNLSVNAQQSGQINNNVSVGATSGDATVANNTQGGDATSGSANAVANVVNLANTSLTAARTFIGMVNIYGNLNGDILLPAQALQSLISSNAGTGASAAANSTISSTSAQAITNNVAATASTGQANVTGNTSAGSATSGSANTNVTLLNLTGHQVVGADSLLVFVNVLGSWMGLIMNAPNGTTAAALGGGLTTNNADSSPLATDNATVNDATSTAINNNVRVSAQSGNATVAHNTNAGSATTGDATASANILNMTNDSLRLTNWFGILFINVFGNWIGSFGIDTAAGNAASISNSTGGPANNGGQASSSSLPSGASMSASSPTTGLLSAAQTRGDVPTNDSTASDTQSNTNSHQNLLGASTKSPGGTTPKLHNAKASWQFTATGVGVGVTLILIERLLSLRKARAVKLAATAKV
ncbi:MAG TPA: hypothetical protein VJP80_00125 [Candidatus Saccharimonadales bacterium]|nr:hypothetical protein [Candidatus Saccharimonadales bacterium]